MKISYDEEKRPTRIVSPETLMSLWDFVQVGLKPGTNRLGLIMQVGLPIIRRDS